MTEEITTPERSLVIQMDFYDGASPEPTTYASRLNHPDDLTAEQYATEVADLAERTALFHLGALPILQKVEATA